MEKIKIGLVSTSQLSFPGDKKTVYNNSINDLAKLSQSMGFELCAYPTTVITRADAAIACDFFKEQEIDFLLIQHTSYSAGELAVVFSKLKNVSIGLWAIPEGKNDGVVPFNSFCSINMHMSIYKHYIGMEKIKWFFGNTEDGQFKRRLEITVRALTAIKNINKSRVGLIGGVAPGFNDLYDDERNIAKLFDGLYFNRLHEFSEIKDIALKTSDKEAEKVADEMVKNAKSVHRRAADKILLSTKVYLAYKKFIAEHGYDALAVSCWPKFQDDFGYSVCSVVGKLNGEGTVVACEGDVLSAVSMLALKYIAKDDTMLMDMSNYDNTDSSVLLWHCGPACGRFCENNGYSLGVNYHGMAHIEGEEPNCCGVTNDMVFDENDITIMRLSGEVDKYLLGGGHLLGDKKPSFLGSRGWLDSLRFNGEDISAEDLVNTILVTGFQHHFPAVIGDFDDEVKEFAAWLGLSPIEKVAYKDYLLTV